ncbi:aldo/keto reductase [Geminicoccus flavidas]|uniref:aldo/keto reductase n=1 Tax=Geminicoccus flavidas TaxID=2506407 RepID=UPI0013574103|nr:aldo/keto reductase [Geminicoccus flavidas]
MDPLATRPLGRTGIQLNQMGFGGAPLGDLFDRLSEAQAEATLQAAWDGGIRYYDTAPWYGRGQSEHRFGRFLYRQPRDGFVLSTKVGRILKAPRHPDRFESGFWAGGLQFDHVFDYSYDAIMRAFEDSLQRLGMNRIDLLIIHDLDFRHHATEPKVAAYLAQLVTGGFRALEELRDAGIIRAIGAGINELGMMPRFLDLFDLDFFLCALRYSLMEHDVLDSEFPYCARRQVGIIVGGAFSSGITATGPVPGAKYNYEDATPDVLDKVRRIQAVCERHGVPLPAVALQFPLGHPIVSSVIPGGIRPEHVIQNIEHMQRAIPADLWAELKQERLIRADAPVPAAEGQQHS